MNRRRLKGDGDDAAAALATLYNTLMVAIHLLAPYIPFITENMDQRLALLLPEEERQVVVFCDSSGFVLLLLLVVVLGVNSSLYDSRGRASAAG
jgi:isoleucyl-tRNA synthetase